MARSNHRVAVLVLEGAKPLDVGIPAQVFTTRASMPYEVRVCGAAPGLVTGGDGLSYHVADGLEALEWAETVFIPGYRHPDREDPPARGRRRAPRGARARGPARRDLDRGVRARRDRPARRQAGDDALALHEGARREASARAASTRTCCSSTRAPCSPRRARHPASTSACTSCAATTASACRTTSARRLVAAPYRSGGQAQYVPRSVPEPLGERVRRDPRVGAAAGSTSR